MTVDLRVERRNRGLSVSSFAREIGIPYYVLRDAEKGAVPRGPNAVALAEYFGKTVVEMWPEPEEQAA